MISEKMQKHLNALKERHEEYERKIAEELEHPLPDDIYIKSLKKLKLKVKDEIDEIESNI